MIGKASKHKTINNRRWTDEQQQALGAGLGLNAGIVCVAQKTAAGWGV